MKLMQNLKYLLAMGVLLITATTHAASWVTDLNAGRAQAQKEGKFVMINFTGSDWCQYCIKLKQEVLSQPEFEAFASRNLVLVEIDFPKRTPQAAAVQKANASLVTQYKVDGFPTLVFLNPQGKVVHREGYHPVGAKAYVKELTRALGVSAEPPPVMVVQARTKPAPEPVKELPLYGGAPVAPPQRYTELVLKSISGTKNRRFALVNNQTLAVGESARVKLEDSEVKVRCLEIRARSVVVAVDGQEGSREIFLRD
jgi:protein disulfide-isomerase